MAGIYLLRVECIECIVCVNLVVIPSSVKVKRPQQMRRYYKHMMTVMRKPLGESFHCLLSNIWIMLYELSVMFVLVVILSSVKVKRPQQMRRYYKRMMTVMRKPLGESCHCLLSNIWIMLYELSVMFALVVILSSVLVKRQQQ